MVFFQIRDHNPFAALLASWPEWGGSWSGACFAGQVGRYLGDQVNGADLELDGASALWLLRRPPRVVCYPEVVAWMLILIAEGIKY